MPKRWTASSAAASEARKSCVFSGCSTRPIYTHDDSNIRVMSNTVIGWSDTSSGNSVKLKNVDHVEVAHNIFFTSGIIGRVETQVAGPRFVNVWIHSNIIHQGQIDIWTPPINPTAVRIEENTVSAGWINATRDVTPALFNQTVDLGDGLAGGIYNNVAASYSFTGSINASGNSTTTNSLAQVLQTAPVTESDVATDRLWQPQLVFAPTDYPAPVQPITVERSLATNDKAIVT